MIPFKKIDEEDVSEENMEENTAIVAVDIEKKFLISGEE